MKSNFLKKVVALVLTSLFLASAGAIAAEKSKCPKGQTWDPVKKECVKKETK